MRTGITICVLIGVSASIAADASSQEGAARLSLDWSVGVLVSMPDQFEDPACGSLFGGEAGVGASWRVTDRIALGSSVSIAVRRPVSCSADPIIPPDDGSLIRQVFPDELTRNPVAYSTHRVTLASSPGSRFAPRALLGGGRLWTHERWFWSLGVGLPISGGARPWVVEVERISLSLPFVDETRVFAGGVLVDRFESEEMTLGDSMWSIRVRVPL